MKENPKTERLKELIYTSMGLLWAIEALEQAERGCYGYIKFKIKL